MESIKNLQQAPLKATAPNWRSLIASVLDPLIAVVVLVTLALFYYGTIRSADVVLAIVTFSLMYPSKAPFRRHARGWIRGVVFNWVLVYFLILALGIATRLLPVYNGYLLLQWFVITPIAMLVAHSASPFILPV